MFFISELKAGVILSYVNIFLQTAVNFLYIPLLLYYIGRDEYGLYQLIGSLVAYLAVMDFGLSNMVIRFYAKYRSLGDVKGAENILAIAWRGYLLLSVTVVVIGGIFYQFIPSIFNDTMSDSEINEGMNLYLLMLFNFILDMMGMVYYAVINAQQKFLFLKGTSCLQSIMQPLFVLFILQKVPTAMGVALATTTLNMILILWRYVYAKRKLNVRIVFHYWNKKLLNGVGHFLLMQMIVTIADLVFFRTNQVILGIISGTAAVATYAIAANIQLAYSMMSTAISGVFLPRVTEMVAYKASSEELSALFTRIGRLQFWILGLVGSGFVILGKEFVLLWAGADFADSYYIALLIILPFTTDLIQNIGFSILQAMNRYEIRAIVQTMMGVLNIILAIPLGIKYGGIGCAMATGICMFLGNGIGMSYCYYHYIQLNMVTFWRQIMLMFAKILLLTTVMYYINTYFPMDGGMFLLIKILIYVVAYSFTMYFCANGYERSLCINWLRNR